MKTDITRTQTPEERELNKKRYELSELETELAQRELDLTTLQAELHSFEARYIRIVGVCYAELDEIEAQIAEAEAGLKPKDNKIQEEAAQARAHAQESAQAAAGIAQEPREAKFAPSESLKKLYREVAKCIHPDLATDEKERTRRQHLMADANCAYEEGDEDKLRAILAEWETSPESVKGDGTAAELVRAIRKIAQVEKRLRIIEMEIAQLEESDHFQLKIKVEMAENEGRDLLVEMALRVNEEIDLSNKYLAEIIGRFHT
jgi:multidrug efflux pump subunit AcrA (membrane-fusion protein)